MGLSSGDSAQGKNSLSYFTSLQTNSTNSLELGYGPGSLAPVSQYVPVYTVNDQLWIQSNYNTPIGVELEDSAGGNLTNQVTISPGTIESYYHFGPALSTTNLTLLVSGSQSFNVSIQFVNPANDTVGTGVSKFSVRNDALFGSIASLNLADKFDIQECLTNASSSSDAQVPLPSAFGTGLIGIDENPSTLTAELFTQKALLGGPFTFSYELLANYTYALSDGHGYVNSEVVVARSNSVFVQGAGEGSIPNVTVSDLASLRSGRYVLRAFFENGISAQISETALLLTSPLATSWFWLGSCSKLSQAGPPTISFEQNLTGSIGLWPKYLDLLYQVVPGIDSFANISLNLNLNRVTFVVSPNQLSLPSDIQVSSDPSVGSNLAIQSLDVGSEGAVFLITSGTYPISATFDLSFAGKTFATENVVFQSPNNEVLKNVNLGELDVSATRGGVGVFNATVTILDKNLNATIVEHTDPNGNVDIFVPPGEYAITIQSGNQILSTSQSVSSQGITHYDAVFPVPVDYTQDAVWVISVVTVIGAIGNFWLWIAKRRLRKFLGHK
jgi:hypothetical protein